MKITVLLFGMLADKSGCKNTTVEIDATSATVSDVLKEVEKKIKAIPEGTYLFAVNEEQADLTTTVKDNDEMAIMPPFSGG